MSITTQTVMRKMEKEMQLASSCPSGMLGHIANIKLLCELLLENEEEPGNAKLPGHEGYVSPDACTIMQTQTVQSESKLSKFEEDDANGDSLFDF